MPKGWCKHVAALCFTLIEFCETKPSEMLQGLGINLQAFEEEERESAAVVLGKRVGDEWPFSPSTSTKRINISRTAELPPTSRLNPIELE